MSEADDNLQVAQEQLYENEGLRRHLTDEQSKPLLEWASQQLQTQTAAGASLEAVQNKVSAVLKLIDQAAAQDDTAQRQRTLKRLPHLLKGPSGSQHAPLPPPPLPAEMAQLIEIDAQAGAEADKPAPPTPSTAPTPPETPETPATPPMPQPQAATTDTATPIVQQELTQAQPSQPTGTLASVLQAEPTPSHSPWWGGRFAARIRRMFAGNDK